MIMRSWLLSLWSVVMIIGSSLERSLATTRKVKRIGFKDEGCNEGKETESPFYLHLLQEFSVHLIGATGSISESDSITSPAASTFTSFDINDSTSEYISHNTYDEDLDSLLPCANTLPDQNKLEKIQSELNKYMESNDHDQKDDEIHEIEVYWHDFFPSADKFLDESKVHEQIQILNDAYSGNAHNSKFPNDCNGNPVPPGVDTGIRFVLKKTFRNYCATNDRNLSPNSKEEQKMKKIARKGDCTTLNIYSGITSGYLGWASYPWDCEGNKADDGVVIHRETLPGDGTKNYSDGDILVHEVGHWLGLFHTFGEDSGSCSPGDFVNDTPPLKSATTGCPRFSDTCGLDKNADPIHNFMDYSYNCCMYEFTKGQIDRMSYMMQRFRIKSSINDGYYENYYEDDDDYDDHLDDDRIYDNNDDTQTTQMCFCVWVLCYGCGTCYE